MPYRVDGNTVVHADTGEPVEGGNHGEDHEAALAHLAALEANVDDANKQQVSPSTVLSAPSSTVSAPTMTRGGPPTATAPPAPPVPHGDPGAMKVALQEVNKVVQDIPMLAHATDAADCGHCLYHRDFLESASSSVSKGSSTTSTSSTSSTTTLICCCL